MTQKKIALIVQRFGEKVNGGSEVLAKMVAEKLSLKYDITVLTSRAIDPYTWKPELPEGKQTENGIKVIRFNHKPKVTAKEIHTQNRQLRGRLFYQKIYRALNKPSFYLKLFSKADKDIINPLLWIENQGPVTKKLTRYLKKNEQNYDAFIFVTYLYYPSVAGLMAVPHKSIFIPTMHDEPEAYDPVFQKTMAAPKSLMFLTESEKKFSNALFNISHIRQDVMSVGIDPVNDIKNPDIIKKFAIQGKYIVYVGRIDAAKGCNELLKYFAEFVKQNNETITLVLAGKNMIDAVNHKNIIYAGFVSDEEKEQLMKHAEALIIPSKYESLSLVVLESFACRVPVIANGACEVLKDHIDKSHGGWTYRNENEFVNVLNQVIDGKENTKKGLAGYKYVTENYSWEKAMKIFDDAIDFVIESNKN
jgi:glycosyltransferase involved in cell wall biosynthesis